MEYQELNADQQAQLIRNRILQYEADHFAASLDKQIAESRAADTKIPPEEQLAATAKVAELDRNMATLEKAIETTLLAVKAEPVDPGAVVDP